MIIHAKDAGVTEINMVLKTSEVVALCSAIDKALSVFNDYTTQEREVMKTIHCALLKRSMASCPD